LRHSRPAMSGSGPYFGMVTSLSGRQQDSFAEQREAGAAVCLAFEHFDPVDVAFDDAGVPGQGEPVDHGVVVVLEAAGEGVQVGLVIGFDSGDPVVELVAVPAGEDLGELGDVPGEGVQVRAAVADLREF